MTKRGTSWSFACHKVQQQTELSLERNPFLCKLVSIPSPHQKAKATIRGETSEITTQSRVRSSMPNTSCRQTGQGSKLGHQIWALTEMNPLVHANAITIKVREKTMIQNDGDPAAFLKAGRVTSSFVTRHSFFGALKREDPHDAVHLYTCCAYAL